MRSLLVTTLLLILTFTLFPVVYAETKICHFGIPPWQKGRSFSNMRQKYLPLLNWMSKQTDCKFVPIGAKSYEDLVEKLASGTVSITEISPVPYILAKRKNPDVNVLVTALMPTPDKSELKDSYLGYIVTLKKYKNINNLKDLKGKNFGFVKPESSSGFKYPHAIMREKGINYKDFFSESLFLGSHPNVTGAIVEESIIAGATWQYNLEDAQEKYGDVFKILLETPPIPNILIATHPNLPKAMSDKLQVILPKVPEELLIDIPAKGFVVRPDSFYDVVRTVVDKGK